MSKFIGSVTCFTEDDEICKYETIIELTDFRKSGVAEIALDIEGVLEGETVRAYVSIPLAALISAGMAMTGTKSV